MGSGHWTLMVRYFKHFKHCRRLANHSCCCLWCGYSSRVRDHLRNSCSLVITWVLKARWMVQIVCLYFEIFDAFWLGWWSNSSSSNWTVVVWNLMVTCCSSMYLLFSWLWLLLFIGCVVFFLLQISSCCFCKRLCLQNRKRSQTNMSLTHLIICWSSHSKSLLLTRRLKTLLLIVYCSRVSIVVKSLLNSIW